VRLTTISRAAGLRLARDLPAIGAGRVPLLRHGTVLTERYQRAVAEHGIHAVWVEDDLSAGIEPAQLMPEEVRTETAARVHQALESARDAFAGEQPLPPETLRDCPASCRDSPRTSPTALTRRSRSAISRRPMRTRTATP
jgi:hypothetical protein